MGRWGATLIAAVAVLAAAGCGGDEVRYNDAKIVERLDLEQTQNGYRIGDGLFCEVEPKLLNDADEVGAAEDRDDLGLVVSSREGNAGVVGVPVFNPECADDAKRKLDKLDPPPKD